MTLFTPSLARFWVASPHQWGPGKVHYVDPENSEKTLCGKRFTECPGRFELESLVTCGGCKNTSSARELKKEKKKLQEELRLQRQEEYRVKQDADRVKKEADDKEWWNSYNIYLKSEKWRKKTELVLKRSNGICEACLRSRARQVHHLTYKHVFDEPLFDLVAVCVPCHEKITELDREKRLF